MANMTITNIDNACVVLEDEEFRDETLTFAGADTFVEGTILARKTTLSVSAGTVQGGTGTGTISAVAFVEGPEVPLVGVYVLTCIEAVAHGGVFQLKDPNGAIVGPYLPMTPGAGGATTFEVAGLTFILTDATDFIVGNFFNITVVAGGKLVPFDPAGIGGVQNPVAVLTYEVTKAGSGDVAIRACVSGKVNKNRLIIDVDGTGANITNAILDQLRGVGIIAIDVDNLSAYDTQD